MGIGYKAMWHSRYIRILRSHDMFSTINLDIEKKGLKEQKSFTEPV